VLRPPDATYRVNTVSECEKRSDLITGLGRRRKLTVKHTLVKLS
jgi:hypothetical protein